MDVNAEFAGVSLPGLRGLNMVLVTLFSLAMMAPRPVAWLTIVRKFGRQLLHLGAEAGALLLQSLAVAPYMSVTHQIPPRPVRP